MLTRLLAASFRNFSQLKLPRNKANNMDKCYFRHENGDNQMHVTFMYKINESNSPRQFNFSRKTTESVEALLLRISTNVEKALSKKKKKKFADNNTLPKPEILLFDNQTVVPNDVTCSDLLAKAHNLTLKVADQSYKFIVNAPWTLSISLPSSILSGFPVYPINFKTQFAKKEFCSFTWYIGAVHNEKEGVLSSEDISWEEVGRGYTYTPSPQNIGSKLKVECVPGDGLTEGLLVEAVSAVCVQAGPGRCPFENRHAFTQNKLSGSSFRVISYNILADLYCDSDHTRTVLHPYCPPYALHIDYRKQLILKEILGYNADIACLQEVDLKIFNHELTPVLGDSLLKGVFTKKGKEVAEGLACFYRTDRFRLISSKGITFSEELKGSSCLKPIWQVIKDNKPLTDRLLDRSTAGQATVLQSLDNSDEILVVGNTHLYFHPDADHIRLIQGGIVIYWLQDVVKSLQESNPNSRISLILCGDFNSVPSCGIYQLYTTGFAPSTLEDWNSKPEEAVEDLNLKQDFELGSACGTPEYTNFTAEFADCLDYIFYDKKNLSVEQVIPLPSVEELKEHTAIPSVVFPSDHVALVADLSFIK